MWWICAIVGHAPTLSLDTGVASGKTLLLHRDVHSFLGLPFARPPVGALRWQPPERPESWAPVVRDATKYGKSCMQSHNAFVDFSKMSEDCLYLNIAMPKKPAVGAGYPTVVFFYGGSWKLGSAMFPLYSGDQIASHHDVVVVTINYRLGAFGYLGSERLRASDGSTGNYGIQDQRAALEWVHRNAKALGCDVTKLMIFGESAGAGSVANHLVRPRSWGLFTRAGMESGPVATWTSQSMMDATAKFDTLVARFGCGGASTPSVDVQRCMREVAAVNLTSLHHLPSPATGRGVIDWSPVVDGVELTALTVDLASAGKIAPHVPVLLGSNRDEGSALFGDLPVDANATVLKQVLTNLFASDPHTAGSAFVDSLLKDIYPPSRFAAHDHASAEWWAGIRSFGDLAMSCAARRTARWVSNTTLRGTSASSAFLYFFTRKLHATSLVEAVQKKPLGVFHGSELLLVFNTLSELLDEEEKDLALDVMALWAGFADSGRPNGGTRTREALPTWPAYDPQSDLALIIDTPLNVSSGLKRAECDFWDRHHAW